MNPDPFFPPNFHAEFRGGPLDGMNPWIREAIPIFRFSGVPVKPGEPNVLLPKPAIYRLVASQPHPIYEYDADESQ
jgi:hypothetical protein